jgi:hypothetical protein
VKHRRFVVSRPSDRTDGDVALPSVQVERLIATVQRNGFRLLEPVERDLLRLAASVVFADRGQRRPRDFNRRIALLCGVEAVDVWSHPVVAAQLKRCLKTLTRDAWNIGFQPASELQRQLRLRYEPESDLSGIAVPYSDGLDSLATRALLEDVERSPPLCVTVITRAGIGSRIRAAVPQAWAWAAFAPGAGKHAEPSFRSRSFLFLAVAAVVARLRGIRRILVPETGQGAIGAALTPIDEPPAVGAHPRFTQEMTRLFELLWPDGTVRIEHPNLWLTKAQLLGNALSHVGHGGISPESVAATRSCTTRKLIANVDDRACGICPNCLTRRVALVNAGLAELEQQEDLIWRDLGAPTLEAALSPDLHPFPVTPRHRTIAHAAVLVHDDLAALSAADPFNKIPAEVRQVAQALQLSEQDVATRLSRLLRQHRDEWRFFLDRCAPPGSWLRALCR